MENIRLDNIEGIWKMMEVRVEMRSLEKIWVWQELLKVGKEPVMWSFREGTFWTERRLGSFCTSFPSHILEWPGNRSFLWSLFSQPHLGTPAKAPGPRHRPRASTGYPSLFPALWSFWLLFLHIEEKMCIIRPGTFGWLVSKYPHSSLTKA